MRRVRRASMIVAIAALCAATPDLSAAVVTGNLKVVKTLLSPSPVVVGVPTTYQIVVTNLAGDATNAQMVDTIDMKAGFESVSAPAGWNCTTPSVGDFGDVTCTTPTFPGGGSATFTLILTLKPGTAGLKTSNQAQVSQDLVDSDPSDNISTVQTPIVASSVPVSVPALVLLGTLVAAGAGILLRR
ncbi:MAG TPA: hypothetical protein VFL12_11995 [Thermoanaerobaculia bacterium]|nr:hypothetical protein [Thermoanaerobaculia bacterium]